MNKSGKQKVLLIGWDAADWQIINPLMDSGKMPTLAKFVEEGVMGNIATLEPVISPILWNSISTGKYGDKHGILGFTEAANMGEAVQPVMSTSRKTKAIWNILQQNNYKVHQIGWWASHPAEPINGISISNSYGKPITQKGNVIPPFQGSIHPEEYIKIFNKFRISPFDITGDILKSFVPDLDKIDQKQDHRLIQIAESLVECTNYHAAATWILENEDWDFLCLYQVAIDTLCHKFMKFFPPQLEGIPDNDFQLYKNVIEAIYIYHDMMLEHLLKLVDDDTLVIIVSDHGFQSGEQRLLANPKEPGAIAYDHRAYGVFCAKGPNIKKDERVYGASLLDVTPTILAACGLPIGKDMDGKALAQLFETPPSISYIDSWDKKEGDSGMFKANTKPKHHTTKEELQQLIDLGYIDDPGKGVQMAVDQSSRETRFNLGRIYMHSNRNDKALDVFLELSAQFPDDSRFKLRLASLYQRLGKFQDSEVIINLLKDQALKEDQLDLESGEKKNKKKYRVPVNVLTMLEANNLLVQKKPKKALQAYQKLQDIMAANPKIHIQMAKAYMQLLQYRKARDEYEKCLKKDPDNASAWVGLAHTHTIDKEFDLAAEYALNAIGRSYYYPRAHFILGFALKKLGQYEDAINAFEVALVQNPANAKARNHLIEIYRTAIKNDEALSRHLAYFNKDENEVITIVSGIPRSGTSLMMQMLEAAGLDLITDGERKADENNPKGYYEFDKVKSFASDVSWLVKAKGKVVKIVSQLLFHLPDEFNYRVIFMNRDLKEIIDSQQKMVARLKNQTASKTYPTHLEIAYKKNLERVQDWQKNRTNVEFISIDYNKLMADPSSQLSELQSVFNDELSLEKMLSVIDNNLYRSKIESI